MDDGTAVAEAGRRAVSQVRRALAERLTWLAGRLHDEPTEVWVAHHERHVVAVRSSEQQMWADLPDDFDCAPCGEGLWAGRLRDAGTWVGRATLNGPITALRRRPEPKPPKADQPSGDEVADLKQVVINANCDDLAVLLRAAKWIPQQRYALNAYWRVRRLWAIERGVPVYIDWPHDYSEITSLMGTFSPPPETVLEHDVVQDNERARRQRVDVEEWAEAQDRVGNLGAGVNPWLLSTSEARTRR